jgi:hypothetical protein
MWKKQAATITICIINLAESRNIHGRGLDGLYLPFCFVNSVPTSTSKSLNRSRGRLSHALYNMPLFKQCQYELQFI